MERRGNRTYVKVKWGKKELGMDISEGEWSYIWRTQ